MQRLFSVNDRNDLKDNRSLRSEAGQQNPNRWSLEFEMSLMVPEIISIYCVLESNRIGF